MTDREKTKPVYGLLFKDHEKKMNNTPRLICALDESGQVICRYNQDKGDGKQIAEPPKKTPRGYAKALLDVFLPAGYPHTVTPDYTPYQVYDSLQAFSSSIAGLLSSRAVLQGFGVGDATSSATGAVLLTVLQESTGRLATILFAHRLGQAIEPECKFYRFLADILNDTALLIDVLTPALPGRAKVAALCGSGVLRALCGVSAGAAKASLSAHFAKNGNLAELNAKDGSQETVISLMGMLAGSLFVRFVEGRAAVWAWMFVLIALHLWTNYQAVRSVQMRSLNRQRATIVLDEYHRTGRVLRPDEVAKRERILSWKGPGVSFGRTYPQSYQVRHDDLVLFCRDQFVIPRFYSADPLYANKVIFLKQKATSLDSLKAYMRAAERFKCESGKCDLTNDQFWKAENGATKDEDFWKALSSAGWDLDTNAVETGSAIRLVVE